MKCYNYKWQNFLLNILQSNWEKNVSYVLSNWITLHNLNMLNSNSSILMSFHNTRCISHKIVSCSLPPYKQLIISPSTCQPQLLVATLRSLSLSLSLSPPLPLSNTYSPSLSSLVLGWLFKTSKLECGSLQGIINSTHSRPQMALVSAKIYN